MFADRLGQTACFICLKQIGVQRVGVGRRRCRLLTKLWIPIYRIDELEELQVGVGEHLVATQILLDAAYVACVVDQVQNEFVYGQCLEVLVNAVPALPKPFLNLYRYMNPWNTGGTTWRLITTSCKLCWIIQLISQVILAEMLSKKCFKSKLIHSVTYLVLLQLNDRLQIRISLIHDPLHVWHQLVV